MPYRKRNLLLHFLQLSADGSCTTRSATRHQILSEVRDNWEAGLQFARQQLPKRKVIVRDTNLSDNLHVERQSRTQRGRNIVKRRSNIRQPPVQKLTTPRQHAAGNRLTTRDLRQIDPAFSSQPAIWVREDAMVVSIEDVKALILHDRLLVFDAENDAIAKQIRFIRKRLVSNAEDVFTPFEFRALEGILIYACGELEKDFLKIDPDLKQTLMKLPERVTMQKLERLRFLEQRLNYYYGRARKVQNALQQLLDEDEDMAEMYLTEKRRNPTLHRNPMDHNEAEMLLETYMQSVDDLTSRAGLLLQAIDDTENLIEIHLDTQQNRMLLSDMLISGVTTTMSFGTLFTGIFGMNMPLPKPFQSESSGKFYFGFGMAAMWLAMILCWIGLIRYTNRLGLRFKMLRFPGRDKNDQAVESSSRGRLKRRWLRRRADSQRENEMFS